MLVIPEFGWTVVKGIIALHEVLMPLSSCPTLAMASPASESAAGWTSLGQRMIPLCSANSSGERPSDVADDCGVYTHHTLKAILSGGYKAMRRCRAGLRSGLYAIQDHKSEMWMAFLPSLRRSEGTPLLVAHPISQPFYEYVHRQSC